MSTATFTPGSFGTASFGTASFSTATRPKLRITRRGRAVLTVLVAAPLVLGSAFITLNGGGAIATSTQTADSFDYVTVDPGMTLWALAADTAPDADPRDFAADVISLNQLPSAELSVGDRLAIPAKYTR